MPLFFFNMIESQGRGIPHVHVILFYPNGEYNPRADMRVHYDPRRSYLNYLRQSAEESASLVMFVLQRSMEIFIISHRERKIESKSVGVVRHEVRC